ncbi:protein BatD [Dyella dinghuensis]|uniref:Protein BatD n=1 Tax=Dyella dinghuensis TaxID=1920169 RepID=A0A432LT07_9GAMM|nr:BatD family protein [Dyella dinghuensis]RUL64077.1 protein BatD [Dyella dinghuensis]
MMYRWLWLLCLLLPLSAMANGVHAVLDRNEVHLGETVTLNVRIDGTMNASTPDLSALNNDFEILGASTNSVLNVVNGQQTAQVIIGVALRPKHVGDLQIPSLTIAGNPTQPLTLHVDPPENSATGADNHKDVFIDITADPSHAYVGQQLLLRVRLFFDVNINGGTLPDPQADGADLRRLGGDTDYESVRNGKRYHVVERRYALIPQRAGTVTIPSFEFQGEAVEPGDANDPGLGGLFGNSTPVEADSSPVTIDVQPTPSNWGKTTWLPARTLTLDLQGLPSDGKITAGQPLNLHMTVEAMGLPADALPEPSLPTIDGATVYPDQPTNTTQDDGQWLTGRRERGFAIFPQRAGTLTIPATTLTWFDVQSGQQQVATIPARTLTVVAAANGSPATPSSTTQAAVTATPAVASSVPATSNATTQSAGPSFWQWVAIISVGLWLLSIAAFLWWRRSRRKPASSGLPRAMDSARHLRHAFMDAARGRDSTLQAHSLLAWARAERPGLQNLGQLSAELNSDAQREAIERLQRAQYADHATSGTTDLAAVFVNGFVWRVENTSANDSPLPPLYPFKLD